MPTLLRWGFYASFPVVILLLMLPMEYYPHTILRAFYELKWLDEAAHAIVFSGLGIGMAICGMKPRRVFFSLSLFAFSTEWLQSFSGRTSSASDLAWDMGGILVAYCVVLTFNLYNKKVA
jgi:VanZ family protein